MRFLENDTLKLRALEPEDLDVLYKWENNTEFWSAGNTITPYSRYILKSYIESDCNDIFVSKQLRLMVCLKKDNIVIGTIDLFDFDPFNNRVGVGILIGHEYQSKGYASQVLALIEDYSFEYLKLNQLYCNIAANNVISIKLFESRGFEIAGKLKEWLKLPSGWEDNYIYQKLNK